MICGRIHRSLVISLIVLSGAGEDGLPPLPHPPIERAARKARVNAFRRVMPGSLAELQGKSAEHAEAVSGAEQAQVIGLAGGGVCGGCWVLPPGAHWAAT